MFGVFAFAICYAKIVVYGRLAPKAAVRELGTHLNAHLRLSSVRYAGGQMCAYLSYPSYPRSSVASHSMYSAS